MLFFNKGLIRHLVICKTFHFKALTWIWLSKVKAPALPKERWRKGFSFFPTCQVRVVRFYVSCLLLSSSPLLLLLLNRDPRRTVFSVGPQPRPSTPSVPCRTSTTTIHAQCSLPDQPRPSPPSVPCRTSTTTIHAQCSLPDLNREYPRQVFPAGPHVGRYGTKNVQKKVRKNVRRYARRYAR